MSEFRYQHIADYIQELIISRTFLPGQKLPSLRVMSQNMKVSLSTVNQAYLELEKKGIIEARPRSGFFVSPQFGLLPRPQPQAHGELFPKVVNRSQLIRTVLEILGDRSLLPLGIISPSSRLLPGRQLKKLMSEALSQEKALDYAPVEGILELRQKISMLSIEAGVTVSPQDIIITAGAMEALYISLRCVTRPGDMVLIQSPTYFCFLQLLENLGLRAIEISSNPEYGVNPSELQQALQKFDIKACILAPNFNNPDGSLTLDKQELVQIIQKNNIPLIEDDVSGDVYFQNKRPQACKAFDSQGNTLLCSSFSKTIAPGYRIGWLIPGRWIDKAKEIKATTSVCSATPTQMTIAAYLRSGTYPKHLKKLRQAIQSQMQLMQSHLSQYFPRQTRVTRPQGGSVLWVELPEHINSVNFFFQAKDKGIGIAPGNIFSTQDKYRNFIRLSCEGVWDKNIAQGIKTLGKLVTEMV